MDHHPRVDAGRTPTARWEEERTRHDSAERCNQSVADPGVRRRVAEPRVGDERTLPTERSPGRTADRLHQRGARVGGLGDGHLPPGGAEGEGPRGAALTQRSAVNDRPVPWKAFWSGS